MDKKYEIIREKVIKGTQEALDKLKADSKKNGKILIESNSIPKKI
jgi:hypothetical protein